MKLHLTLFFTVVASVAIVGLMKVRMKEQNKHEKRIKFDDIKLRVTEDLLEEYLKDKEETTDLLDKNKGVLTELGKSLDSLKSESKTKKTKVDKCVGQKKTTADELAAAQSEFDNFKAEAEPAKSSWEAEMASLQKTLEEESAVCKFLKPGSKVDKTLCKEAPKEAPKPELKAAEEVKAEAPKAAEEVKAEVPKAAEEVKAEAPKAAEEVKAEAPKAAAEEVKAEAPKAAAEEVKAEAPKAAEEEVKAEAPKAAEEVKAEVPKAAEEVKAEVPKNR